MNIKPHHMEWECPEDKICDSRNRVRTRSLFVETINWKQEVNGVVPLYSLYNQDTEYTLPSDHPYRPGETVFIPSAYLIYMSSVDEFEASIKLVGSTRAWNHLSSIQWFLDGFLAFGGLHQWREDMRLRDLSKSKRILEKAAEEGNVTAAKALYQNSKSKQTAGRKPKNKNEGKGEGLEKEIEKLHDNILGFPK